MNIPLQRLEGVLQKRSYLSGYRFSKKDVEIYEQIGRLPSSTLTKQGYPNVARWASHIWNQRRMISVIPDDGFQFLEEVLGDDGLSFAKTQNERILNHLGALAIRR